MRNKTWRRNPKTRNPYQFPEEGLPRPGQHECAGQGGPGEDRRPGCEVAREDGPRLDCREAAAGRPHCASRTGPAPNEEEMRDLFGD